MYSLGHGLSPALIVTKQRSESTVCKAKCLRERAASVVNIDSLQNGAPGT
jgi:hypothetical protein